MQYNEYNCMQYNAVQLQYNAETAIQCRNCNTMQKLQYNAVLLDHKLEV